MKWLRLIFIAAVVLLCFAGPGLTAVKVKSLCEVHYPSDARIEWRCVKLEWKDTPEELFGKYWGDVLRFNRLDRRHFYGGRSIKVPLRLEDVRNFTPLPARYPDAASLDQFILAGQPVMFLDAYEYGRLAKRFEEIKDFTPLPATFPDAAREEKFILVDQSEMFLGAYEYGRLVFSSPVAVGVRGHRVPNGEFWIDAADRRHKSNLYRIEELGRPYPMHYALRFFTDKSLETTPSYYIHGRDLPGYPASHGCIGLYDEEMQVEYYSAHDRKVNKPYYHELKPPFLEDAKRLYQWVIGAHPDPGAFHKIDYGPRVLIMGAPPL